MPIATITSKGQLTVPKEVRKRLGLGVGDRVLFRIEDSGEATLARASRKSAEVFGMLAEYRKSRPVSVAAMDRKVRERFGRNRP